MDQQTLEEIPPCIEDAEEPAADAVTGEILSADDMAIVPVAQAETGNVGAIAHIAGFVRLARGIADTEIVPVAFRKKPDTIVACFAKGFEMGMGPMQALDSFDVIQGKVAMKPEAMRALIMSHGHFFVLRDGMDNGKRFCEAEVRRSDWPDTQPNEVYRYDWDDAELAKLVGKDNWQKTPRAMLDARATGGAARRYFADVIQGMSYTTGEVEDFES